MAGWLALMLIMAIAGRETTRELNVFQIMEVRSILGFVMLYPLIRMNGGFAALKTTRLPQHVARNLIHYCAQLGWFFALTLIPHRAGGGDRIHHADLDRDPGRGVSRRAHDGLEDPGYRARRYRRRRHRPAGNRRDQSGPVDRTRRRGRLRHFHGDREIPHPHRQRADDHLLDAGGAVDGRVFSHALRLGWPSAYVWGWIVVIAVCGTFSHYCLANAMRYADATVVVPMDFLRVPLTATAGWLIYSERLDLFTVLGAALILTGNLLNLKPNQPIPARA